MESVNKNLGKVTLTCEGYWNVYRPYDKLCLVTYGVNGNLKSYISKTDVPMVTSINDGKYWQSLESIPDNIISICNNIYLKWNIDYGTTRLQIPELFRRKGIIISYSTPDNNIRTEKLVTDLELTDKVISDDSSWSYISDALNITGNVTIGTNGNWFIDGKDIGFKATGPKGNDGVTPTFRNRNNKIEYSYDDKLWVEVSDYLAAYFRFQDNKIQITKDSVRWDDLSDRFGRFKILDYKNTAADLPSQASQGDMYMVGTSAPYTLYIKNATYWIDSGNFLGLSVEIVDTLGDNHQLAVSQYGITDHIMEYNVSNHFTNATNTHDHSPVEVIKLVPAAIRKYGLKVSFITKLNFIKDTVESSKLKHTTMQYIGTSLSVADWENINNWEAITPIYLTEAEYDILINKEYLLFYIEESEI